MKYCTCMLMAMASLFFCACGGGSGSTTTPPPNSGKGTWTWVNGANVINQSGVYGTQGTTAPTNVPGAREQAVSWTDASGNFWLFGGNGFDFIGNNEFLNDLWKYSSGQWTWMSGSAIGGQPGTYGTQGAAAPNNIPGARNSEVRWIDAAGNLWLFGGGGYDSNGTLGPLNDLWEYSAGQWTWVGGPDIASQAGVYGTQGTAASGNIPGARFHAASWTDGSGNFWLFGGNANALNSSGEFYLNDLWMYSAGEWTWMGGSSATNQVGTYGTRGVAAAGNVPGAREQAFTWADASGNFWLFGGNGFDSAGNYGFLNDLWKYSSGQWAWIGGSNLVNQAATYGTEGVAAAGNIPGARNSGVSWTDASGNLWLFGGGGYDSNGGVNYLNDVWEYSAGQWTWQDGSNSPNQPGSYGTEATASSSNLPGGRFHAVGWLDASGNYWLFGGNTYSTVATSAYLNDLWEYQP
jgi:N-acetylneuraminic acid mutarotase